MNRRARCLVSALALAALPVQPSMAAQDPATLADLTAVITLLGMPCGQVTSAKRQADNDHIAVCENGTRYRVFVDAQGRVVAQKQ